MADKSTSLVLDALRQAAADPAGVPLHGGRATPGLFATTALAKQAAQRCKDEGLLQVVRTEARGKTSQEICALTEKGLAYLLDQVSPKQVLEDFVRALDARQTQVGELVAAAQEWQSNFNVLKAIAEKVLAAVGKRQVLVPGPSDKTGLANGNGHGAHPAPRICLSDEDTWTGAILDKLSQWQASGASEDCPLPELLRQARVTTPALTIGQFHDSLRRLHDQEQIYLHPWTGPMYELPEPPCALLIGHEVAYYASLRKST